MQKRTLTRFDEIVRVFRKYDFDKLLGKTTRNHLNPFKNDDDNKALLEDDFPEKLRLMLQELGTTFIKFGQLLSTRPDIVGEKISKELSRLQDDNPSISYEEVKEIIEDELGKDIDELFDDFSKEPIATASIGQVHIAKLSNGEKLAVKVQKKDIESTIETDLTIMKFIAIESNRFNSKLDTYNLPGMVEEFDKSIHKEMDYDNELMNLRHLSDNFRYNNKIKVPKVYPEYSTGKVLTMEFIEGEKLAFVIDSDDPKYNKVLIADRIVRSYFKQIFEDGFFHADPHPSNIIISDDNTVVFIDVGMMGILDEDFKINLAELMIHFSDRDIDALINQLIYMDILNENVDIKVLKRDLNDLFSKYYGVELNRFEGVIDDLLTLMQRYKVKLPNELVLMSRGISMIENIGQHLDPSIDVVALLKPIAKKLMVQRYNPIKIAKNTKNSIFAFEHLLKSLPRLVSKLFYKFEEGDLVISLEIRQISELTNQISLALVIAALLIGSSLVMTIDKGPMFFDMPLLGFFGFVVSLILGIFTVLKYMIDF